MKPFLNLCCVASSICLIWLIGSEFGFLPNLQAKLGDSSEQKSSGISSQTFSPHVRSKVAQYFATYRTELHGLPAKCVEGVSISKLPEIWSQSWLPIGTVIGENDRAALIKVPAELERVLTANSEDNFHYFLAGKNLVALDSRFHLVDSVWIPTIRLDEDPEPNSEREVLQLVSRTGR